MKKQLIFCFACLVAAVSWSQQDVQYSQYMYNMSVINPAYTTDDLGMIKMGILHRTQWVGVEGGPTSTNVFAHTSVGNNVELGVSLVNDNIGDVLTENNITGDFAYKLRLNHLSLLSFGLKVGLDIFDANFNGFELESGGQSTDDSFNENINQTFFNVGFGFYYNTSRFYAGVSVPNFMKSKYLDDNSAEYQGAEEVHYYFTSGYVMDINESLKIKPSILLKAVKGAPAVMDMNVNFMYNDKFEFGIGYRLTDEIGAMASFRVLPELRIGYAYDYTNSNLSTFSSGSHEFCILYDLDTLFNGYNKSPRFF